MNLDIGRNGKGKLVCWLPAKRGGVTRPGYGEARFDGILVSDLVLTIPQSPLPYLQPVFGEQCPQFEVKCEVSPEETALIEKMKQVFAEQYR